MLLDTHIWFWWVRGDERLSARHERLLQEHSSDLAVSVFSCWEIAKLVSLGRMMLSEPVEQWIEHALLPSGVRLLNLTPRIAVEATQLPGDFHRDPADQIIVATARVHRCPLVTVDAKIRDYPHVDTP